MAPKTGTTWNRWHLGMFSKPRAVKILDDNLAIPMPSARKIRQMKELIVDMMLTLAPTVFSEAGEGEDDPKVGAIHDAHDALEDALQALEEI